MKFWKWFFISFEQSCWLIFMFWRTKTEPSTSTSSTNLFTITIISHRKKVFLSRSQHHSFYPRKVYPQIMSLLLQWRHHWNIWDQCLKCIWKINRLQYNYKSAAQLHNSKIIARQTFLKVCQMSKIDLCSPIQRVFF